MAGKLLGDGCITKQQGRKPRFQFIHRKEDLEWTQYCYERLRPFIPINPPSYKKVVDKRLVVGFSESFFVQSKTNDSITYLESIWYHRRTKILPFNFLQKYLDAEALAWWYQDDGHLKLDCGIPRKIILSTDSFLYEENILLIKLLENKFKLFFSLDGQNRLILYDQFQIMYFLKLVEPYIHFSMARKLHYNMPLKQLPLRTTIYLHKKHSVKNPTREINEKLQKLNEFEKIIKERDSYIQFYLDNINWLREKSSPKSYQIKISDVGRANLSMIRKTTGLSLSQIVEWCFK